MAIPFRLSSQALRFFSALALSLFSLGLVQAQSSDSPEELPSIQTDRPTQGESPNVVPKGLFQTELGFGYGQSKIFHNTTLPEALLRYGLGQRFELRAVLGSGISGLRNNGNLPVQPSSEYYFSPVSLGFKVKLREQSEFLPMVGVLGYMSFGQLASSNSRSKDVLPSLRLVAQYDWAKFSLLGNLRANWYNPNAFGVSTPLRPDYVYTLCGSYALAEGWTVYLETFGSIAKRAQPSFQTGLIWLIHPQFQVDLSGGLTNPFDQNVRFWYVNAGLSFRLGR